MALSWRPRLTSETRHGPSRVGADLLVAVWEVLNTVPDPRRMRTRRHAFATKLAVALWAGLAGARPLVAIADWAGDLPAWCQRQLNQGSGTNCVVGSGAEDDELAQEFEAGAAIGLPLDHLYS